MRSILQIILIFYSTSFFAQTNFSRGFDAGYKKGYCYEKGIGCIEPISPVAPIPTVSERSDSYQDGYNRGFTQGLNDQKNQNNNTQDRQRYKTAKAEFVEDNIYQPPVELIMQLQQKKQQELETQILNRELNKSLLNVNPDDFAVINIYRPRAAMGSLLAVKVIINGVKVADLYSGGHLEYKIHDLSSKNIMIKSAGEAVINLIPQKGSTYFFETNPKMSGFTLKQISEPIPEDDLKKKNYIKKSDYTF